MPKKSKKRSKKKAKPLTAKPKPITIKLTDNQKTQAQAEIDDHDFAIFEITDTKGTCALCTTKTIHL